MSDFNGYWKNYEDENYVLGSEEYCTKQVWNHQQAIIDDLKTQLNNMEACYIGVKKQVKSCESLVGQWREKRMGGWSDYARGGLHSRQDCADDLEKSLRGEHE